MIKSISKLIDTNVEWNNGTLTDVVAVNDSLELANNYSLSFDGTGDYVSVAGGSTLVPTSITLSAFIYKDNTDTDEMAIISKSYSSAWEFSISGSTGLKVNAKQGGVYYSNVISVPDVLTLGQWNLVTYTYDEMTGENKLYVDGVLVGTTTTSGALGTSSATLYIGSRGGSGLFLHATARDVRIYNLALTPAEVLSLYQGTQVSNGLIALFPLNEGEGTIAYDTTGSNDGTIYGATWIIYETSGNRISQIDLSTVGTVDTSSISWESLEGLYFDGVDDYAIVANDSVLSGLSEFTFETKLYLNNDITTDRNIFWKGNQGTTSPIGIWADQDTTDNFAFLISDGTNYELMQSISEVPIQNALHLACSFSSNGTMKIYINGIEDNSINHSLGNIKSDILSLYFGSDENFTNFLNGIMYNTRLWNTQRTQTQIQDNMDTILDGTETGLIAYYKIDEGTGTALTDYAGSNNGTINGASWLSDLTTTTIETSVDGGSTWQTATNGSSILNLTDIDTTLDIKQTLSTADTAVTPRLLDLYWEVISSDTDITNIKGNLYSDFRNSPLFKYGGLSNLKGNIYWDSRSSPIFKEGIDSIIKVKFLPAKWRKAIEIINQWQTEAKPTSNWQSETKPNNIWQTETKPANNWQSEVTPNNTWEV